MKSQMVQKNYGVIEVNQEGKDIVEIASTQFVKGIKSSFDLVQVERENIPWLIAELQKSYSPFK